MYNNSTETISGERLTFFQIFNEKNYHIEIPIIQRDYAQGRASAGEVRKTFLTALYDYLDENKKHRDLDFIYGSLLHEKAESPTKFIPLDGQQRLTTLFLLHWYLANRDDKMELFRTVLVKDNKSKFTYETRTSSREFCNALLTNDIHLDSLLPPDKAKSNSLSKTIKDSKWYFLSWENDSTIKAILTMLDAIHDKFKDTSGFFERLVNNKVITFQFLKLNEFKLTDDLYIKMNARGKPLTTFENFKAKYEQTIKETTFQKAPEYKLLFDGVEETVSVQKYFSHKIDTDWANLFWKHIKGENGLYDDLVMNFIRTAIINHYASVSNDENTKSNISELRTKKIDEISFLRYSELNCFDEKFIVDLIEILDLLKNGDNKAKTYLNNYFYYDEMAMFEKAIKNSFDNFTQRVEYYAYCQYLIKWKSSEGLEEWMRVIHNLAENTIYNDEDNFVSSVKSITKLLPFSNQIIQYLFDNKDVDGFLGTQIKEEKIKVHLLLKGEKWSEPIYQIEQHPYFKGQIGFILYYSEIEDFYNTDKHCNWGEDKNELYFNRFQNYSSKANAIFAKNGVKSFGNYLWERALLTKEKYLLREGRNLSFCINGLDRDISWKRLLLDGGRRKDYPGHTARRNSVKQIFDDQNFDKTNVKKSLKSIISKSKVDKWYKHFIPKSTGVSLLNELGPKMYIRYYTDNHIYLLHKERMSGVHCEYYSFIFFLKELEKKTFNPFTKTWYNGISGETDLPCAVIDDWKYKKSHYAIDIRFSHQKNKYELRFFDRESKAIPKELLDIMEKDFNSSDKYGDTSYLLMGKWSKIKRVIKKLCSDFQNL